MATIPRPVESTAQRPAVTLQAGNQMTNTVEPPYIVRVPVDLLVVDLSLRLNGENAEHIELLAESISILPPIIVHRATMRVIDGVHRLRAALSRGNTTIGVQFFDGDENEAYVLSVRQNTAHGLPLTRADRKAAARRILQVYPLWSDRAIAKVTGLSPKTVGSLRPRSDPSLAPPSTRVGLDGRVRRIGHQAGHEAARQYLAAHPQAPTDDVARAAGLSLRSARNVRHALAAGDDERQALPQPRRSPGDNTGPFSTAVDGTQPAGTNEILRTLRNDPSLRFTDGGRAFLQLLGASVPWGQNADHLIDNLPLHCIQMLAEAMYTCAQTFQAIAEKLETRYQKDAST